MIKLEQNAAGVRFAVKAHAGARRNAITGEHDGALKVAVTPAPEKGRANKAIVELLARELQLSKRQVELLHGETSSQKQFLVRGIEIAELQSRLEVVLSLLARS